MDKNNLGEPINMEPGMIIHFPELEWHVFGYEKCGYIDESTAITCSLTIQAEHPTYPPPIPDAKDDFQANKK